MTTSALMEQLLKSIKLAFRLSPIILQSRQHYKTGLNYQEIQKKDILTLDEAAFYIGITSQVGEQFVHIFAVSSP